MERGQGIRRLFRLPARRAGVERDVEEELAFHLSARADELAARGLDRDAARAQALREFGDVGLARAELSAIDRGRVGRARRVEWWRDVSVDICVAVRGLVRRPAFLAVALLTLALAIGANTAIFSIVDAVLLRPLPFHEPERLVRIWPEGASPRGGLVMLRERNRSLEGIAGFGVPRDVSLTGGDVPVRLTAAQTSGDLFEVLGVGALVGRTFVRADEASGAQPVVMLGHALWRQRFGADPSIVGRPVTIDGIERTVVGVMPPFFRFPSPDVQLWIPAPFDPTNAGEYWGYSPLRLVGRLRPGVDAERARADLAPIFAQIRDAFPWRMPDAWGRGVDVVPLQRAMVGGASPLLLVLLGAVGLVLLLACVNVANLVLVRGITRERELAVRAALGAGRWRVARQLLTESCLLVALGGAAGLALGAIAVRALVPMLPEGVPRIAEIGLDVRVLAFTIGVTALTSALVGLVPALRASRPDLQPALRSGTPGGGGAGRRRRLAEALVVAQVGLASVLVVAAGLLVKSLWRLEQVDPGFRAERVITAEVPRPAFSSDSAARSRVFYESVLSRVRALPGVRAAAVTSQLPFGDGIAWAAMEIEAHPTPPGAPAPTPNVVSVSADYTSVMGIPLLAGRALTPDDREGAPLVAVVDDVAARQLWPGGNPIGQRLRYVWQKEWITVVGVVGAVKRDSLNSVEQPSVYRPFRQGLPSELRLVLRTDVEAGTLAPALRAAVAEVNAGVPVSDVRALDAIVTESAARTRFATTLLAAFAGVALLLGAVGIYGVVAYSVSRRTREIGVRMALGAAAGDVSRMVLADTGRLVGIGLAIGLAGALVAVRMLRSLLYDVGTADPAVYLAVPAVLLLAAGVAVALPVHRAARVDPLVAMRAE